jgi:hypothetical protein
LRNTIIKYYLEEYFGIDVQMKVTDLEFWILSIWLDSPMPSLILYHKTLNSKFKIPSKIDYEQNINPFWIRFVVMGLKCDILDVAFF